MYATEFGQNTFDEVNRIQAGSNYGWPTVEGTGTNPAFTNPLLTWTTAEASPSGLAFDDGSLWAARAAGPPAVAGPPDGHRRVPARPVAHLANQFVRLRTAVAAPDGTLWVTTSNRDGRGTPTADDDRILALHAGRDRSRAGRVLHRHERRPHHGRRSAGGLLLLGQRGGQRRLPRRPVGHHVPAGDQPRGLGRRPRAADGRDRA